MTENRSLLLLPLRNGFLTIPIFKKQNYGENTGCPQSVPLEYSKTEGESMISLTWIRSLPIAKRIVANGRFQNNVIGAGAGPLE